MYKIYVDNNLFCDSSINELVVMNPVVTLEANTAGQFTFTIPVTHPYYDNITRLTSVVEVYRENKMIFRGFVSGESKDLWNNKAITCEGDLSYLNDSILRPHKYQGQTVLQLINAYITEHNSQVEARKQYTVGTVTVTDPNDYISCYTNMNSTMTEIKEDLIDDLGGYLRIRRVSTTNYLDYIRGDDFPIASQIIELGVNLINYKSNIDDIDLCTRVIPLGALLEEQTIEGLDTRLTISGQPVSSTHLHLNDDYLQSTSAINNFGIITKTVTFDDVTTASKLVTKGNKYLSQNQFENLVIEVSAVDLGLIDSGVDTWELLQKIRVISAVHGLDSYFPLTKMVLNLANPENDTFTLGTKNKLQKSLTARTTEASEATRKLVDSVNQPAWLAQAQQNALNMLLDETQGGHVIFEYEEDANHQPLYVKAISVCDTDKISTSLKRWRWSENGFGFMSRTSTSSDWSTLKVALTSDGAINADRVLTGTMQADRIKGGTLILGGSNNVNGVLQVKNASGTIVGKWTKDGIDIDSGDINISNGKFHVDSSGNLTATSAQITGDIKSGSTITGTSISGGTVSGGTISGGTITGTSISGGTINGTTITNSYSNNIVTIANGYIKIQYDKDSNTTYYGQIDERGITFYKNSTELMSMGWDSIGITLNDAEIYLKNSKDYNTVRIYNELYNNRYSGHIEAYDSWNTKTIDINGRTGTLNADHIELDNSAHFYNDLHIDGNLYVSGSHKDRIVKTDNYGNVALSAYETPKPMFSDEGHGQLDSDGICYIWLDKIFLETIDTTHKYRAFLTKYGQGDIWIDNVEKDHFVVRGTANLEFDWKIDCVQKNCNLDYCERKYDIIEEKEFFDLDILADEYLKSIESEVLNA